MFATGIASIQEFFAELYANPSLEAEALQWWADDGCSFCYLAASIPMEPGKI